MLFFKLLLKLYLEQKQSNTACISFLNIVYFSQIGYISDISSSELFEFL